MKFIHGNTEYRITFSYDEVEAPNATSGRRLGIGRQLPQTTRQITARIYTGERNVDEVIIGQGTALCVPANAFTKDRVRKNALRQALANEESREFRRAAWTAYHQRPGGIHSETNGWFLFTNLPLANRDAIGLFERRTPELNNIGLAKALRG